MKKSFIVLIFFIASCIFLCTSCTQKLSSSENDTVSAVEDLDSFQIHFQFLGIPIHGTPEQFGKALEKKGFFTKQVDHIMESIGANFLIHMPM